MSEKYESVKKRERERGGRNKERKKQMFFSRLIKKKIPISGKRFFQPQIACRSRGVGDGVFAFLPASNRAASRQE